MEIRAVSARPDLVDLEEAGLRRASDADLVVRLAELASGLKHASVFGELLEHGLLGIRDDRSSDEATGLRAVLSAAEEVGRRLALSRAKREQIQRPRDVALLVNAALAGIDRERLLVLVCDAGNRLIQALVVTEGTADRLLIPVREIVALALQHGGRAFAVAHNHPSGDTTPSPADVEGTRALAAAAKTVGLRFLGHVVVADGQWQAVGSSGEVGECGVDG